MKKAITKKPLASLAIDTTGMMSSDSIKGENAQDTKLLRAMAVSASEYISSQTWCVRVDSLHLAYGVGGIVAIFLVELTPRFNHVDSCLWVIVGDIPPAYLVLDNSPTAADALEGYWEEMMRWVEAIEQGHPTENLIPVNVAPTLEWAEQLRGRLEFLRTRILPVVRKRKKSTR